MNILILSYYYPPVRSISALRAQSWAENWAKTENKIDVVTKAWDGSEKDWNAILSSSNSREVKVNEQNKNLKIHYLPYKKYQYSCNSIKRKYNIIGKYLKGIFNPEIDTLQFYEYALQLLHSKKYDIIVATAPPLNILYLANKLHKKTQVPWIADFRDFENSTFLNCNKVGLKDQLLLKYKITKVKSVLRSTSYITSATNIINRYFGSSLGIPNKEILNGFEQRLLNSNIIHKNEKFSISVLGTIYPSQDFLLFANSLKKLDIEMQESIQLKFIGIKVIKEVYLKIKAVLDNSMINCIYTDVIPRTEAIQIGRKSDLLYYPAWKGYRGIYSGKIFEYLALRKNILIAPGDNDVIENLIIKTKSGKVANTEKEVIDIVSTWFHEWKPDHQLPPPISDIDNYSRESQADRFLEIIKKVSF